MKKIILALLFLCILSLASAGEFHKVLVLDLVVKPDSLEVIDKDVILSAFVKRSEEYDAENIFIYTAKIGNKVVHFSPDFIRQHPLRLVNSTTYTLYLDYDESYKKVVIEKHGTRLAEVDLTELCNLDNQCNNKEDYLSCPSDCLPYEKDGYCNYQPGKEQCDPDCPEGVDWDCRYDLTTEAILAPSTGIEYDIFVVLGIFVVGVSVIIVILSRRKKQKLPSIS
jgi:LPXTG-motif cell wall-anchored protein